MIDPSAEELNRRIQQLEIELNDMTQALAHAWDQLDLFMRATPEQIRTTNDIVPVLESIMEAVRSSLGAVFMLTSDKSDWFTIPSHAVTPSLLQDHIKDELLVAHSPFSVSNVPTWNGQLSRWLFMPIRVNSGVVGAIGVGRFQGEHSFDAAETRILTRIAERASGQIAAANLAESQARELQIKRELQIAGLIQRSIQPLNEPVLPGMDTAADWQPAQNVGGDAWGWVMQPSGRLGCFLLDVAGKGLPAALAASALHTALKLALRLDLGPSEVLRNVNEDVYEAYSNAGILATAVVVTIDPLTGRLEQANAGHPPTLMRHGDMWQQSKATMPPLGVLAHVAPMLMQSTLTHGDLLILYSDGLTEIETADGLWGVDGLKAAVPSGPIMARQTLQAVLMAAERVRGEKSPRDDQTLFVLRYL